MYGISNTHVITSRRTMDALPYFVILPSIRNGLDGNRWSARTWCNLQFVCARSAVKHDLGLPNRMCPGSPVLNCAGVRHFYVKGICSHRAEQVVINGSWVSDGNFVRRILIVDGVPAVGQIEIAGVFRIWETAVGMVGDGSIERYRRREG